MCLLTIFPKIFAPILDISHRSTRLLGLWCVIEFDQLNLPLSDLVDQCPIPPGGRLSLHLIPFTCLFC